MLKRIFILILALCCAFSFISQPVSAASTGVVLTAAMIGMAVAGAFGITYANNSGYEAFGNSIHDAVTSTGAAGSDWWNRSLAGNIVLNGLDSALKVAVWGCAKKAADSISQTGQGPITYDFTFSRYSVDDYGNVDDRYKGYKTSWTSPSGSPIYCLEYSYLQPNSTYPYYGYSGTIIYSSNKIVGSYTPNILIPVIIITLMVMVDFMIIAGLVIVLYSLLKLLMNLILLIILLLPLAFNLLVGLLPPTLLMGMTVWSCRILILLSRGWLVRMGQARLGV